MPRSASDSLRRTSLGRAERRALRWPSETTVETTVEVVMTKYTSSSIPPSCVVDDDSQVKQSKRMQPRSHWKWDDGQRPR